MGTPDLRGSYGTFSFYTDDPMTAAGVVEGGQIIPVQVEESQVAAKLIGPDNTFARDRRLLSSLSRFLSIRWSRSPDSRCRTRNSCCARANGATGSTFNFN